MLLFEDLRRILIDCVTLLPSRHACLSLLVGSLGNILQELHLCPFVNLMSLFISQRKVQSIGLPNKSSLTPLPRCTARRLHGQLGGGLTAVDAEGLRSKIVNKGFEVEDTRQQHMGAVQNLSTKPIVDEIQGSDEGLPEVVLIERR